MASTKAKGQEAAVEELSAVEEAPVVKAPPVVESVYTAAELADNHRAFQTSREIVVVALRLAGKQTATFAEAKDIIEKFKHKEVK